MSKSEISEKVKVTFFIIKVLNLWESKGGLFSLSKSEIFEKVKVTCFPCQSLKVKVACFPYQSMKSLRKWKWLVFIIKVWNLWESESDSWDSPCQSLQCLRSGSKDLSSPPCSLHTLPTNQINHTGTELSAWRPFEHICSIFETYFHFFLLKIYKKTKDSLVLVPRSLSFHDCVPHRQALKSESLQNSKKANLTHEFNIYLCVFLQTYCR